MSQHHGKAGRYRDQLQARGTPKVCAYEHRIPEWGPCEGEWQAAHVVPLADRGPKDWTVWACAHHNRKDADEAAASRRHRTGRESRVTEPRIKRSTAPPARPGPSPLGGLLLRLLGLVLLVGGLGVAWASWTEQMDVAWSLARLAVQALVGLAVLSVALAVLRWRARVRARIRASVVVYVAEALKIAPHQVTVRATSLLNAYRRGVLIYGMATYPEWVPDGSPEVRNAVEIRLRQKIHPLLGVEWQQPRNRLRWAPTAIPYPAAPPPAPGPVSVPGGTGQAPEPTPTEQRASALVQLLTQSLTEQIVKGQWCVTIGQVDAVGPLTMTITYPPKVKDAKDSNHRGDIMGVVNAKTPGRWAGRWETEASTLHLVRRPDMPKRVVSTGELPSDSETTIPFGVGEHGEVVCWDPMIYPHVLVSGETGSGKTVVLRNFAYGAAKRGWEVRIIDPKRIEFASLRDWPGVVVVATMVDDMVRVIEETYAEMEARYALIEQAKADKVEPPVFDRIVLILDEARELIDRLNNHWQKVLGNRGEHPANDLWRSIARLGRSGGIHLILGIQRPDASVMSGEARANFGGRISVGSLDADGAKMMYGATDIGRDMPDDIKGRATAKVAGDPQEVQVTWVPEPGPNLSQEDEEVLGKLIPVDFSPARTVLGERRQERRERQQKPPTVVVGDIRGELLPLTVLFDDGKRYVITDIGEDPEPPDGEDWIELSATDEDGEPGCHYYEASTILRLAPNDEEAAA
jgi:hypothetical protein